MAEPSKILQLRQLLAERHGPEMPSLVRASFLTGLPLVDEVGLPSAALTEIFSELRQGGCSLLFYGLLHAALRKGIRVMLIDGKNSFAPKALPQSELNRLLWVQCHDAWEAIKIADLAVRDGNMPLVLLLMALNPPGELKRIPATAWHRLQMLAEKSAVTLVVFTPEAQIGCARLRLSVRGAFPLEALHHRRNDLLARLNLGLERRRIPGREHEELRRPVCA